MSPTLRKKLISLCYDNGGHLGGSLSCLDILYVLYSKVITPNDDFIMSKGHAVPALYTVLNHMNIIPDTIYKTYGKKDTLMIQHPSHHIDGITYSSGALGNGLSVGIGMRLAKNVLQDPGRVFVLMGDGELNEGTVWEGLMYAGKIHPSNLVAMVDYNKLQASASTQDIIPSQPLFDAIEKLGWNVKYADGHNHNAIMDALAANDDKSNGPVLIVFDTIKGKGVSFMENNISWHHRQMSIDEYSAALKELDDE